VAQGALPVPPISFGEGLTPLYAAPTELRRRALPPMRILITGSCLVELWSGYIEKRYEGVKSDYILFNNGSELPEHPPAPIQDYALQILQPALRAVMPESLYMRLDWAHLSAFEVAFETARERLFMILDAGLAWNGKHGLLAFVTNFTAPQQNSVGRTAPRNTLNNIVFFVEELNRLIDEYVRARKNVYVVDINQISSIIGKRYIQDDAIWAFSHGSHLTNADYPKDQGRLQPTQRISHYYPSKAAEFFQLCIEDIFSAFRTLRQIDQVKMVIFDLDDTLWRGVAGETAEHHRDVVEGWPLGLVEALLILKKRGVMLAIASKNTEDVIEAAFQRIWRGRLTLDDFVVRKINWRSKADNIRDIIEAVNIQASSVVFVDDNPREREEVVGQLPDIRVIGAEPYILRRILLWSAETQSAVITDESLRKTDMVKAQVRREETRKRMSPTEFLASLDVRISLYWLADIQDGRFARALELINKTNQFNTTGVRWSLEDMARLFAAGGRILVAEVEDLFTNYGLVSGVILRDGVIEQWVMSCRVVGLEVETAVMSYLAGDTAQGLAARTRETQSNLLSRTLFDKSGFTLAAGGDDGDLWVLPAGSTVPTPAAAKIVNAPAGC